MLVAQGTDPWLSHLSRGLEEAGALQVIAGVPEALAALRASPHDLLLLAYEAPLAPLIAALGPLAARLIVLLDARSVGLLARVPAGVGALLYTSESFTIEELQFAVRKLAEPPRFGLEQYLAPGPPLSGIELFDSSRRSDAFDSFEQFLADCKLDSRQTSCALTVADEFITNGFYNAPVDGQGRRLYANRSRIDPVVVTPSEAVHIAWGCDARQVGVAVRDVHGSLTLGTVTQHLQRAFQDASVSFTTSGAGLGLVTAFRTAARLIFHLVPGEGTECIGLIPLASYRKGAEQGKSLQIYQQGLRRQPAPPKPLGEGSAQ